MGVQFCAPDIFRLDNNLAGGNEATHVSFENWFERSLSVRALNQ